MEARELRIGNLLESANSERVFSVTIEDLVIIEAGSKCRPIQLTEEWLLKFGFKKEDDFFDGEYIFSKTTNEICLQISFNREKFFFVDSLWKIELKHVHSFQNLCFELTGKELDIC